jgi:hypothetical protein
MILSIAGAQPPQVDPAAQTRATSLRLRAPSRTTLRIVRSVKPLHWQMTIDLTRMKEVRWAPHQTYRT